MSDPLDHPDLPGARRPPCRHHGYDPPRRRLTVRRQLVRGVILGSFMYLIVSCFYAAELDRPKIDRSRFRFDHKPKLNGET